VKSPYKGTQTERQLPKSMVTATPVTPNQMTFDEREDGEEMAFNDPTEEIAPQFVPDRNHNSSPMSFRVTN